MKTRYLDKKLLIVYYKKQGIKIYPYTGKRLKLVYSKVNKKPIIRLFIAKIIGANYTR